MKTARETNVRQLISSESKAGCSPGYEREEWRVSRLGALKKKTTAFQCSTCTPTVVRHATLELLLDNSVPEELLGQRATL
ncbi:hypothetical protein V5799_027870 [Amblyomma americanum]|uniref:Uncharacterized protein n=1 Tax=Amblyomma americanum TaxID=6943 RepID=A0AAQ4DEH1_AMBAM